MNDSVTPESLQPDDAELASQLLGTMPRAYRREVTVARLSVLARFGDPAGLDALRLTPNEVWSLGDDELALVAGFGDDDRAQIARTVLAAQAGTLVTDDRNERLRLAQRSDLTSICADAGWVLLADDDVEITEALTGTADVEVAAAAAVVACVHAKRARRFVPSWAPRHVGVEVGRDATRANADRLRLLTAGSGRLAALLDICRGGMRGQAARAASACDVDGTDPVAIARLVVPALLEGLRGSAPMSIGPTAQLIAVVVDFVERRSRRIHARGDGTTDDLLEQVIRDLAVGTMLDLHEVVGDEPALVEALLAIPGAGRIDPFDLPWYDSSLDFPLCVEGMRAARFYAARADGECLDHLVASLVAWIDGVSPRAPRSAARADEVVAVLAANPAVTDEHLERLAEAGSTEAHRELARRNPPPPSPAEVAAARLLDEVTDPAGALQHLCAGWLPAEVRAAALDVLAGDLELPSRLSAAFRACDRVSDVERLMAVVGELTGATWGAPERELVAGAEMVAESVLAMPTVWYLRTTPVEGFKPWAGPVSAQVARYLGDDAEAWLRFAAALNSGAYNVWEALGTYSSPQYDAWPPA